MKCENICNQAWAKNPTPSKSYVHSQTYNALGIVHEIQLGPWLHHFTSFESIVLKKINRWPCPTALGKPQWWAILKCATVLFLHVTASLDFLTRIAEVVELIPKSPQFPYLVCRNMQNFLGVNKYEDKHCFSILVRNYVHA